MLVDRLHMRLDPRDLAAKSLDSLGKLVLGKGAEVLPGDFDQRIGRLAREKIVDVHGVTLTLLPPLSINRAWQRFQT